jgi:hypothetical protein
VTCVTCLEARCVCRQPAVKATKSYPLFDLPDPSKIQSTVGVVLKILPPPPTWQVANAPGPRLGCKICLLSAMAVCTSGSVLGRW